MAPVSTQPSSNSMNVYNAASCGDEKHSNQCQVHFDSDQGCPCAEESGRHNACHKARLRRILLPIALLLLALGAMLVISCATDVDVFEILNAGVGSPLGKRATTTGQSSFTNNKLYLIIIFVGLVLVLFAGIMLSFCCCKGAFENPICCPCYLCACCGGLACLECIGCGLCAAGLDLA